MNKKRNVMLVLLILIVLVLSCVVIGLEAGQKEAGKPGEKEYYVSDRGRQIDEVWNDISGLLDLTGDPVNNIWDPLGWVSFRKVYALPTEEFTPSDKCQDVVEYAKEYLGTDYGGLGLCSAENAKKGNCTTQCGSFVTSVFYYRGLTPLPAGNGNDICFKNIPRENRFDDPDLLQPGDMFSTRGTLNEIGWRYGHTGIFVGRGTVSGEYKKNCYKEFESDPTGDLIFIHSTGPVCYGKYENLFDETKGRVLETFCRHEKCYG